MEINPTLEHKAQINKAIGINLGIKDLVIASNKLVFENISKKYQVKKLENKLKREQRRLSKRLLDKKKGNDSNYKNINKNKLVMQKNTFKIF